MRVIIDIEGVGREVTISRDVAIARLDREREELTALLEKAYNDAKRWIEDA